MPRAWPIPVTLFRHHVIITLAIEFPALDVLRRPELRCGMFSPRLSIAQTTRAVLLAMATRTTLVGRRASKLSCHWERRCFLCLDQRRSARAP